MKFVAMQNQSVKVEDGTRKVSGGTAGELSADQLAQLLQSKSVRKISDQAARDCARAILDHPGGNDAGGALVKWKYKKNAIYHNTRNKPSVSQGCSVFFADAGNGYAKLIAVGNHIGTKPNVYALDWVTGKFRQWHAGRSIQID